MTIYQPLYHALMRKYGQVAARPTYVGALPADHERRMQTNPVYRAQVERMMRDEPEVFDHAARRRQVAQDFTLDGQRAAPITQEAVQRPRTSSQGTRTRDFEQQLNRGISDYQQAASAHDDYISKLKDADQYSTADVQRHNDRIAQLRAQRDAIGQHIGTNPRNAEQDNFEARRRGFMMGNPSAPTPPTAPSTVDPRTQAELDRAVRAVQEGTYGNVGQGQTTRYSTRNQPTIQPAPAPQAPAATAQGQQASPTTTLPTPTSYGGEAPGAAAERARQQQYASYGGEAPGAAAERARQQQYARPPTPTFTPEQARAVPPTPTFTPEQAGATPPAAATTPPPPPSTTTLPTPQPAAQAPTGAARPAFRHNSTVQQAYSGMDERPPPPGYNPAMARAYASSTYDGRATRGTPWAAPSAQHPTTTTLPTPQPTAQAPTGAGLPGGAQTGFNAPRVAPRAPRMPQGVEVPRRGGVAPLMPRAPWSLPNAQQRPAQATSASGAPGSTQRRATTTPGNRFPWSSSVMAPLRYQPRSGIALPGLPSMALPKPTPSPYGGSYAQYNPEPGGIAYQQGR